MTFNFSEYSVVYFTGSAIALFLTFMVYSRRPSRGVFQLTGFALFCTLWSLGAGLESGALGVTQKTLFAQYMEYPGVIGACLFWLFFALEYSGSNWWRKPANLILIGIIPLVTFGLVITNNWHHWYWSGTHWEVTAIGQVLFYERGPWYWVFVAYTYSLYIAGAYVLLRFGLTRPHEYRSQIIGVCAGIFIPFMASVIYLLRVLPFYGLDLAPFSFSLAGVIYAVTFFRLGFLNVVPIARSTLVENLPYGILVVDTRGCTLDLNPASEKYFGVKRVDGIGHPVGSLWSKFKELLAGGGPVETITPGPDPEILLDVSITPLLDVKQRRIGNLLILRDISERQKVERNLRESESRYSTLVEQSNEGVLIVQRGVCVFSNRTISELSGYRPEEIRGQAVTLLVPQSRVTAVPVKDRKSLENRPSPWIYEAQIRCKNGEYRTVDISEGKIVYEGLEAQILSVRDITERKQVQQKLEVLYTRERELKNELQAEIEKRSVYTRSLVQELKVPLTAISTSIIELQSRLDKDIYLALVKNIGRASFNLDQRIDELIELANGEVGMLRIEAKELDLSVLLQEIISEMAPVAAAKGLLTLQDIPELPTVLGDRSRLRQVMTNLLSNAIKFTNRGSILIKATKTAENEILVQVCDTGRGMAADEVENIFDPYRRKLDSSHDLRGLGIGLALSKMFVELHQGRIFAESTPGKGSTFSFTIPVFHPANKTG
jgi:PAS domain S-box-containing protein